MPRRVRRVYFSCRVSAVCAVCRCVPRVFFRGTHDHWFSLFHKIFASSILLFFFRWISNFRRNPGKRSLKIALERIQLERCPGSKHLSSNEINKDWDDGTKEGKRRKGLAIFVHFYPIKWNKSKILSNDFLFNLIS